MFSIGQHMIESSLQRVVVVIPSTESRATIYTGSRVVPRYGRRVEETGFGHLRRAIVVGNTRQ